MSSSSSPIELFDPGRWTVGFIRLVRHGVEPSEGAGHCWRSRDELISDILLWTPSHGRAKAVRPARTYIQQLCTDTGCCLEDLPGVIDDREGWRKRVRKICADGTTCWSWWWFDILFKYIILTTSLNDLQNIASVQHFPMLPINNTLFLSCYSK